MLKKTLFNSIGFTAVVCLLAVSNPYYYSIMVQTGRDTLSLLCVTVSWFMFAKPALIRLITDPHSKEREKKRTSQNIQIFYCYLLAILAKSSDSFSGVNTKFKVQVPIVSKEGAWQVPDPVISFINIIIGQVSWLTPRAMRRWLKHPLNTSLTRHKKIINVLSILTEKKSAYLALEKKKTQMNTHLVK